MGSNRGEFGARWTAAAPSSTRPASFPGGAAQVAQSVEQRTENPRVGGSIPPLGTIHFSK